MGRRGLTIYVHGDWCFLFFSFLRDQVFHSWHQNTQSVSSVRLWATWGQGCHMAYLCFLNSKFSVWYIASLLSEWCQTRCLSPSASFLSHNNWTLLPPGFIPFYSCCNNSSHKVPMKRILSLPFAEERGNPELLHHLFCHSSQAASGKSRSNASASFASTQGTVRFFLSELEPFLLCISLKLVVSPDRGRTLQRLYFQSCKCNWRLHWLYLPW